MIPLVIMGLIMHYLADFSSPGKSRLKAYKRAMNSENVVVKNFVRDVLVGEKMEINTNNICKIFEIKSSNFYLNV